MNEKGAPKMKIVFTPHTGDFENAYKKRIEFNKSKNL